MHEGPSRGYVRTGAAPAVSSPEEERDQVSPRMRL